MKASPSEKNTAVVKKWVLFCLILLFASALRLLCWWMEPTISRDGIFYLRLAELCRDNGMAAVVAIPSYYSPPLFIALSGGLLRCGIPLELVGVIINMTAGVVLVGVVFFIAKQFFSSELAFGCMMLAAVQPFLVQTSHEYQLETLYLLFVGGGFYFLLRAINSPSIRCLFPLGAGMMTAGALLMRYEAWELLPIFCALFYFLPRHSSCGYGKKTCDCLCYIASIAVGIVLLSWIFGIPWEYYRVNMVKRIEYKVKTIR